MKLKNRTNLSMRWISLTSLLTIVWYLIYRCGNKLKSSISLITVGRPFKIVITHKLFCPYFFREFDFILRDFLLKKTFIEMNKISIVKAKLEYGNAEFWTNFSFKFMFANFGPFYAIPLVSCCLYNLMLDSSSNYYHLIFFTS